MYERRGAGPRVMPGFSCELWAARIVFDRQRAARQAAGAVVEIRQARRALAKVAATVGRLADSLALDKGDDSAAE